MAKATSSQAWLWHRRLSHLNFDTINLLSKNDIVVGLPKLKFVKDHLCSSCELGKAKRNSFHSKLTPSSKRWLHLLHMDLCGPMRVASINGKRYVLVIVDDYSRYTWTHFLRSKDETPEVLIDFLRLVQRGLQAQVRVVRTDKGTEFLNHTLHAYFAAEGIQHKMFVARTPEQNGVVERRNRIHHQMSIARTPEQNGVVERRNRTLVEATRIMLSVAEEYFDSVGITHETSAAKTPLQNGVAERINRTLVEAARTIVYNQRTKKIIETMNVTFNELSATDFEQNSSRPGLQNAPRTIPSAPVLQNLQAPTASMSIPDSALAPTNFSNTPVSSRNVDAPSQQHAQQQTNLTPSPTTSTADNVLNAVFEGDLFVNLFAIPSTESAVYSTHYVDSSNMHTFCQPYPHDYQWTKDH
nr:hypothetical protein [Tanacetum cinerariifolium]